MCNLSAFAAERLRHVLWQTTILSPFSNSCIETREKYVRRIRVYIFTICVLHDLAYCIQLYFLTCKKKKGGKTENEREADSKCPPILSSVRRKLWYIIGLAAIDNGALK